MTTVICNARLRAAVRQGFHCYYCGLPIWVDDPSDFALRYRLSPRQADLLRCTAEHLHARVDGGGNGQDNIVAACAYCNTHRHMARTPLAPPEYRARVASRMGQGKWIAAVLYPRRMSRVRVRA